LVKAVKAKAQEHLMALKLPLVNGNDFVEAVFMVEFRDFWHSTTSIVDLDFNVQVKIPSIFFKKKNFIFFFCFCKVFNSNLKAILSDLTKEGDKRVELFMEYFNKTYIKHKYFRPRRWLHLGRKENQLYDATNNLQEGKNHGFKTEGHFNLSYVDACKKMKVNLDRDLSEYSNLLSNHSYNYSYERSLNIKTKRLEENERQLLNHREKCGEKLKFYKTSK